MTTSADRLARARARMAATGVDVLLCSVGPELPYLTGYEAMPLERVTMLVLTAGAARLVVPALEAPRVTRHDDAFEVVPWSETDDPIARIASMVPAGSTVAISDQTWARFVLDLQDAIPAAGWVRAEGVVGPLRMVKDAAEIEALRAAAHAVDAIALAMRERPFGGRTEHDVHRELASRILDLGHEKVNFAIVGSGPNGASPHHEASSRVIEDGDVVVCDFGGTMHGYCSDITRVFCVGEPEAEVREVYAVLRTAQEAAVQAAVVGATCEDVDAAARRVISDAGYGEQFIHRTGHGIGLDAHEDPYIVAGNRLPLAPGHAFSIEPGIYFAGRYGMRLEDIIVATEAGPDRLNRAARELAIVG